MLLPTGRTVSDGQNLLDNEAASVWLEEIFLGIVFSYARKKKKFVLMSKRLQYRVVLGQSPLVEIQRVQSQNGSSSRSSHTWVPPGPLMDIHKGRSFNFVGKLLGPKGNSLKRLQEETQTKMAILGRGSMRDKAKEEDLRKLKDPKYWHLHEELHVEVNAFAPPAEAYRRMAFALAQLKPFLVPDYYDEIRQTQLRELALLKNDRKNGVASAVSLELSPSLSQASLTAAPPTTASPPCGNELVVVNGGNNASVLQEASSSCHSSPPTPPMHPALRTGVPGLVLTADGLSQLPPHIQVSSTAAGLTRGVVAPPTTAAAVSAAAAKAAYLLHGSRVLPVRLSRKGALRAAALTLGRAAAVGALRHGAAVELISADCADEFLYGDEYPDNNFDGNVYEQAFTTIEEQGFPRQNAEDMQNNGYATDADFADSEFKKLSSLLFHRMGRARTSNPLPSASTSETFSGDDSKTLPPVRSIAVTVLSVHPTSLCGSVVDDDWRSLQ
ncbi:hypothetical protein HPB51_019505 [Rhipicephalus microplus]|uniref:KHDC4/BBP-like KH-domain type I domain-containing protein n=1 Tax=Rhipicephalus microplus TaxID=6941 RepID=A0A9J6EC10_RHIMP|nr:hypothetical protein HPB51_019505 [Rhipicephalus microplus]